MVAVHLTPSKGGIGMNWLLSGSRMENIWNFKKHDIHPTNAVVFTNAEYKLEQVIQFAPFPYTVRSPKNTKSLMLHTVFHLLPQIS